MIVTKKGDDLAKTTDTINSLYVNQFCVFYFSLFKHRSFFSLSLFLVLAILVYWNRVMYTDTRCTLFHSIN